MFGLPCIIGSLVITSPYRRAGHDTWGARADMVHGSYENGGTRKVLLTTNLAGAFVLLQIVAVAKGTDLHAVGKVQEQEAAAWEWPAQAQ